MRFKQYVNLLWISAALPVVLGTMACDGPVTLPSNYVDELFKGDPATHCAKWVETVTDLYLRKLECTPTNDYLHFDLDEIELGGHSWRPLVVSWWDAPPTDSLRVLRSRSSLARMLAPLIDAEKEFEDESGDVLDLFKFDLPGRLIFGDIQVRNAPSAVLIAADLALAEAKRRHDILRDSAPEEQRTDLAFNGPIQKALAPIGRLLRQKCPGQLHVAQLTTELTASPKCQVAVTKDPFLAALYGPEQIGQAVTASQQAQATETKKEWWQTLLPNVNPAPAPKKTRNARPAQ